MFYIFLFHIIMQSQIDILKNTQLRLNFLARIKIQKNHIYTLIGLILYRISLDYSYNNIISYLFGYQHFRNEPSGFSHFISWFFLISLSPFIIKLLYKPTLSSNILSILVLVSLVPITTMIAYNSYYPLEYVLLMYIYWFLLLVFNLKISSIVISKEKNFQSSGFYKYFTITLCLAVIFISWKFTGFRFHFGLMDVYDLRTEARGYDASFILGYLATFSDNLLPVLLVFYLNRNQKIISIILIIIILLNFGITASKQILFLLLLALFGFYFVKSLKLIRHYVWFFLSLIIIGIFEFKIFSTYFISIFSTYRVFFIPAKLHFIYYDYFSIRELDYFRQSIFKWFLNSPYKENIGFILGDYDIGDSTARANNGLFSDAYMNMGAIGVFLFPFILVIILKMIEGSAKGLSERTLVIVVLSISFVILGLPFTTALFSAGIIALVIVLYSLPRIRNVSVNK